jgi:ABC-type antimicrobial peptide transport system permease subunit
MTLVEAGTIALVASLVSAITLIGPALAFTSAALFFAGSDAPFHYSVGPAFLYAAIAVAVVVAGAALPAWRTSRLEVIEALRWE